MSTSAIPSPADAKNDVRYRADRFYLYARRGIALLEWTVLTIAFAYFGLRVLPSAWRNVESDFPNYYIAARLTREGANTSRIYDWIWFQRQKDRMGVDQPVVGTATLTPFSFLVAVPISYFDPLTAKRIWTIANLLFLLVSVWMLYSLTALPWKHLALLCLLWFPAFQNLKLGQMYILLLMVMTIALALYLKKRHLWAGVWVAIGFGLKIFPVLFLLYFIRKKQWQAVAGLALGCALVATCTVAVYGPSLSREYLKQQVPAALRGESLDPYNLARSSPSALLHRLFIFEPALNPNPALHFPLLFAVLHPLIQLAIFAPAILLVNVRNHDSDQVKLEWAAFLTALLLTSTNPAGYLYTVLLLPAVLLLSDSGLRKSWLLFPTFMICLTGACFPQWNTKGYDGWHALLGVPRLYFLLLLCTIISVVMYRRREPGQIRGTATWAAVLMFGCAITIASTWEHQKHLYDDYQYRLSLSLSPQLQTAPISDDGKVRYVAMLNDGYAVRDTSIQSPLYRNAGDDELSFTSAPGQVMVEKTARSSNILDQARQSVTTSNAYNPVLSKDAATLAFLRDSNGRGILWLKNLRTGVETSSLSPHDLNVLDVAFVPNGTVVIAASSGGTPQIFGLSNGQQWLRLTNGADRYPAISPDGHWLAFSRSNGRAWNLWLRNLTTEVEQRLSDADCNQLTATWEPDSKSLLYASDCGRGLFLTALARRRVVP